MGEENVQSPRGAPHGIARREDSDPESTILRGHRRCRYIAIALQPMRVIRVGQ